MTVEENIELLNNDPIAQELLHRNVTRLGYNGTDGLPRVIPIGFLWNGKQIIVCTAVTAPKVNALKKDSHVALTIDTEVQPPHILLVRGKAHLKTVDGIPDEYLTASKKYVPEDQWKDFEVQVHNLYKQMVRIAIDPEWVKIIDFETRFPQAVEESAKK
jgi:hypothetical protein